MNRIGEQNEIVKKRSDDYSDFGKPYYPIDKDPVDSCLPGSFLDAPKIADLGLCPSFMAQRCADNWDEKCDLYVKSIQDRVKEKDFFRDVSSRKYCQLSPDSSCTKMCEPFDPIAQESVSVCKYVGSELLKDVNDSVDIGWYYPVNISPDYMGSCRQTCNKVNPASISEKDPVINSCLKYGYCNDILINICQLAENNNVSISHSGLSTFCSNLPKPQEVPKNNIEKLKYSTSPIDDKKKSYTISIIVLILVILFFAVLAWTYFKK